MARQELAPYAIQSPTDDSRDHREPDRPLRPPFEVDRHRIIECTAFRRLEGKTQVFAARHHDHFRTRLTHTLEAAQIARTLAVALRANEALAEAVTLAHDLGHPPFGHSGEAALDDAMRPLGGFNHNLHTLRVVEFLEHPFPPFRGLNLTSEVRAGLLAHATPHDIPHQPPDRHRKAACHAVDSHDAASGPRGSSTARTPSAADAAKTGSRTSPSIEAQIASVADRIAYNSHDLEDAIGAEFLTEDELASMPLWRQALERQPRSYRQLHLHAIRRAVLDTLLDGLLDDAVSTSLPLLARIRSPQEAGATSSPLVRFSDAVGRHLNALERFLIQRVYKHPDVLEMDECGRETVSRLFAAYREKPRVMPRRFFDRIDDQGIDRVICDYIAGMTDRYCLREYRLHVSD
ncbi:MAG: dGTP triphosphohydrolase [Phycisphaerae bacterium]